MMKRGKSNTKLQPSRHFKKIYVKDIFDKHWFLFGILLAIVFASIAPSIGTKGGPLKPEYTVKYGAVSLIFFISGLSLKTDTLFYTFKQYKLHLFIQGFTFIIIPLVVHLMTNVFLWIGVNSWIIKGFLTVACMPPPVSSAVILTKASQGNETAAIFNSVLGSFLGILITPFALLMTLGSTTPVPLIGTITQLTSTVVLPILIGQFIRKFTQFRGHTLPLNSVGQMALLFVIYTTFCDTFHSHEIGLSPTDILITIFLVLLIQMTMMTLSYALAVNCRQMFTPPDIVAILFCSTHKSLTLGIPILRIMFHGFSHLSQISLPLLIYHPTQIILGGLISSLLKDWVRDSKSDKLPI